MKTVTNKPMIKALLYTSILFSATLMASPKPATVQAEFKRWTAELETLLQGQPKNSELRQNLRLWFTDQGRSLSKVKEPILSASLPSKMWGSAAWVTDSANKNFGALKVQEYRALMGFSNRILDYCFQAYSPKQTVCTDDHYWELKAKNSIYLAQLAEPDSKALLASLPSMVSASFKPLSGGFAPQDLAEIASDRCMGWFRLNANFLTPDFNVDPARLREHAYVEAYIAQAAQTVQLCEQAKANPNVFTRHISDLGIAVVDVAKPVSVEAMRMATPIAERAYNILLADRDDQGSTTDRSDHQLKLFLLAHALGKHAQAKQWAEAIPKSLAEDNSRTGDDFNCRFFARETERSPSAWRQATQAYPHAWIAMKAACPQLDIQ